MSNMSYCRFQNTYTVLSECVDALEEMATGDTNYTDLSQEEQNSAEHMREACESYLYQFEAALMESDAPGDE